MSGAMHVKSSQPGFTGPSHLFQLGGSSMKEGWTALDPILTIAVFKSKGRQVINQLLWYMYYIIRCLIRNAVRCWQRSPSLTLQTLSCQRGTACREGTWQGGSPDKEKRWKTTKPWREIAKAKFAEHDSFKISPHNVDKPEFPVSHWFAKTGRPIAGRRDKSTTFFLCTLCCSSSSYSFSQNLAKRRARLPSVPVFSVLTGKRSLSKALFSFIVFLCVPLCS